MKNDSTSREGAFHDPKRVAALAARLALLSEQLGRKVTVMEVCGTHTHSIAAAGLRRILPPGVNLISGPGCPVCVTPIDYMDHAVALSRREDVIVCSFGDLMRVPSSETTLERERAEGRDIRIVYSARDCLPIATENPDKKVIFLGVGFETTMPTIAAAIEEAERTEVPNFSVLCGAKQLEPPLRVLLEDGEVAVDAFLLPGHVSVILGADFYHFLKAEYKVPCAIAGFAPVDVMAALCDIVEQMKAGEPQISNLYPRVVTNEGNAVALGLLDRFFVSADTGWRGLGTIPLSGLAFRPEFAHRDASTFEVDICEPIEPKGCRCGDILKGTIRPTDCPLFDNGCTPEHPVGACMVSGEGTCAAYYRHERLSMGAGA